MTIETFKIAANLTVTGNAEKAMWEFVKAVTKADEILKLFNQKLLTTNKYLGLIKEKTPGLVGMFEKLSTQANWTSKTFDSLAFNINKTKVAMASLKMEANALGNLGIGGAMGGGRGGGGRHGGMLGRAAEGAGFGMSRGLAGGIALGGAFAGGMLLKKSYDTTTAYQQQMLQLGTQNIPGLDAKEANRYVDTYNRPRGISKLDMLTNLTDAAVIMKTKAGAEAVAPTLAKMSLAGSALFSTGPYKMTNAQLQSAISVAEIASGSKDPKKINEYLERIFKLNLTTGGRVQPSTIAAAFRAMQGYGKGINPDELFFMMEPLFQEYKTRTGTMLGMFYQHMTAGRITTQAAQALHKIGAISDKDWEKDKIGRFKSIDMTQVGNYKLRSEHPISWIIDYLLPLMKSHGLKTYEQQIPYLGKIFSAKDLTLVQTVLQQKEKFEQQYKVNKNVMGLDSTLQYANDNARNAMANIAFSKGWQDFTLSLGKLASPGVSSVLESLASVFEWLAKLGDKAGSASNQTLASAIGGAPDRFNRLKNAAGGFLTGLHWHSMYATSPNSSPIGGFDATKPVNVHTQVIIGGQKFGNFVTKLLSQSMTSQYDHGSTQTNSALIGTTPSLNSNAVGSL